MTIDKLKFNPETKEQEEMSDMEIADELIRHIDNPCDAEIQGKAYNLRSFHVRHAKNAVKLLTDAEAIAKLNRKIEWGENKLNEENEKN